jgi:hypothetical protein
MAGPWAKAEILANASSTEIKEVQVMVVVRAKTPV